MTNKEAKELVKKYRDGTCTDRERAMLNAWYISLASRETTVPTPDEIEQALNEISSSLPLKKKHILRRLSFRSIAAAVSVICLLSAGLYFFGKKQTVSSSYGNIYKNDVAPGGNKAVLELPDGSFVNLSQAAIGNINHEGGALIRKTREDQVVYQADRQAGSAETHYNVIRTPRGGQYQVVLPDGSGAWLNSASSIRFPVLFKDTERKVEITGEVYFEVVREVRNSDTGTVSIPFVVIARDQRIEAIGTNFNVNAYPDEEVVRTTLLEGLVKISLLETPGSRLLKPGEQALITGQSDSIDVNPANLRCAVAWKNGQFRYEMEGIEAIMRQVERWYDVEVIYEGEIPRKKFVGTISRNISLSKFLDILSYTGVNFKIEGRKIIVMS